MVSVYVDLDKVVITGAAQGIGRLMAEMLAAEGCHLTLCDIAEDLLSETGILSFPATIPLF